MKSGTTGIKINKKPRLTSTSPTYGNTNESGRPVSLWFGPTKMLPIPVIMQPINISSLYEDECLAR